MISPQPSREGADLTEKHEMVAEILYSALDEASHDGANGSTPRRLLDLFVLLGPDEPIGLGQLGLDMLASELSDMFGQMWLSRPTTYNADVMLHARVAAPASERVRAGIEEALTATMREFLGPDLHPPIAVMPIGEQSSESVTLQILFPSTTDLSRFAAGFSTRDYFRWQVELGSFPGVGAVTSEPCSVLGADVPGAGFIPPNLMISFAVVGDLEETVRGVLNDLERRLGDTTRPTEIVVGIAVTVENSTPESVKAEIERRRVRGLPLLNVDEEVLISPGGSTTLLFEFPVEWGSGGVGSASV
jgi:hypothetical protein